LLSEASTVPESEVPLVEVGMVDEVNEIDQSNLTMKDMMVVSRDTGNALVPATAVYTDDNNTTHVGMLRFRDCDFSEDNAKISAQSENWNLTYAVMLVHCRQSSKDALHGSFSDDELSVVKSTLHHYTVVASGNSLRHMHV